MPGGEKLKGVNPALQQPRQILGDRQQALGNYCCLGFAIGHEPGGGPESVPIALEVDEAQERQPKLVERKGDAVPRRDTDIDDRYVGHRLNSFRIAGAIHTW